MQWEKADEQEVKNSEITHDCALQRPYAEYYSFFLNSKSMHFGI